MNTDRHVRRKYTETGINGTKFLALEGHQLLELLETDTFQSAAQDVVYGRHCSLSATLSLKFQNQAKQVGFERQENLRMQPTTGSPTYSFVAVGENSSEIITELGFENDPMSDDTRLLWTLTSSHTTVDTGVAS